MFRSSTGQAITVYPNPAIDVLNLNFETEDVQNILIKVLDLNGRAVKTIVSVSNTGTNTATIDIKDLASGQYFIQLYTNDALIFTDKVRKYN
ncbi:hypothetical protein EMGBS15_10710 [Filimonas sp.]|nr:hypothetical protein EMGBS15_10710 [Filimonas sp.]